MINDRVSQLRNSIKKLEEELNNELQKEFTTQLQQIFTKYPSVKSISWTQYTPYFNDGDECTFGCNFNCPTITLEDGEVIEDYCYTDEHNKLNGLKDLINALQNRITKEHFKTLFGDHVIVTAFKNGEIDIQEYYHH